MRAGLHSLGTHLGDQIRLLGRRCDELLAPEADARALLTSTPGMGTEATRTWLAEAPPVAKVYTKDGADRLVATVALDAQLKQSGKSAGKVKRSKRGDRYLRRALMHAAENAALTLPASSG
jgi:transposase